VRWRDRQRTCPPRRVRLRDPKAGAIVSLFQIASDVRLNHRAEITSGVRA